MTLWRVNKYIYFKFGIPVKYLEKVAENDKGNTKEIVCEEETVQDKETSNSNALRGNETASGRQA